MKINFGKSQVRRIAKNTILQSLVFCVIIVSIYLFFFPSFMNLFGKPVSLSVENDLEKLFNSKNPYVEMKVSEYYDSGYVHTKDRKDIHNYFYFEYKDVFYLCKTSTKLEDEVYQNYLVSGRIIVPSDIDKQVLNAFIGDSAKYYGTTPEKMESFFSPYMIDTTANRTGAQILSAVTFLGILLLLVRTLLQIFYIFHYEKHKAFRRLSAFSSLGNASEVNDAISKAISYESPVYKIGDLILYRDWIIRKKFSSLTVKSSGDLVWVYKSITQHRMNGIPTGKSFSIVFSFSDRRQETVPAGKNQIDDILASLKKDFPSAIYGYSSDLEAIYKGDMQRFISLLPSSSGNPPS